MIKIADKARTTFPIAVDFVDGELPTAAKMNGLSRQTRQGLGVLEHMVGDAWNQSGDSVFQNVEDAHNMIPNLSRALGPSRLVNPRIPDLPDIEEYTHKFDLAAGTYEAQLSFPPAGGTTYSWSGGATLNATPEANKGDVTAANEWWIDTDTGRILTFDQIQAAWLLTYKPVVDSDLGNDATWNMIPDPDTDPSWAFRSVKIEYKNGTDDSEGYLIFLPPRGPLNDRRVTQSAQDDVHVPAHSNNIQTTPSVGSRLFWQDDSVNADTGADAEHYRYLLPKILTDNWTQASTVPAGFVYLYDPAGTGTIIEGMIISAEDAATPRKFVLRASGGNLTTWLSTSQGLTAYPAAKLTATGDHSPSMYPTGGLRLITIGTSISAAFSAIVAHFLNHDHGTPSSLVSAPVDHDKVTNLYAPAQVTPPLIASSLPADGHPQYLHRGGAGLSRDPYDNAMLGDLVMASSNSNSNYLNLDGDSRAIWFGKQTTGHKLYFDDSNDCITVEPPADGEAFAINRNGSKFFNIFVDSGEASFNFNNNITQFQNINWMSINASNQVEIGASRLEATLSGSMDLRAGSGARIALLEASEWHSSRSTEDNDIIIETTGSGRDIRIYASDRVHLGGDSGIELEDPLTNIPTVTSKTVTFTVSAQGAAADTIPSGGWYWNTSPYWSNTGADGTLNFYITDYPMNFTLQKMWVWWECPLAGAVACTVHHTRFQPQAGVSPTNQSLGTFTYSQTKGQELNVTDKAFDRSIGDAITLFFTRQGFSTVTRLYPVFRLQGTTTSISPHL